MKLEERIDALKRWKDTDLQTLAFWIPVIWDELSEDDREKLKEAGYEDGFGETGRDWIWQPELDSLGIDLPAGTLDDFAWDDWSLQDVLLQLLGSYPHYLVDAPHARWDGTGGSWTETNVIETLDRRYDCHIYPRAVSARGKTLICSEYSHDAPMGCLVTVIGLTEREYSRVKDMDAEQRQRFVEKRRKTARWA